VADRAGGHLHDGRAFVAQARGVIGGLKVADNNGCGERGRQPFESVRDKRCFARTW